MSANNPPPKAPAGERLLTTREAAAYLKVSEASIRRWTDGGLLPASRVGRRRARRLREEDLKSFLDGAQGPQAPSPPADATRAIVLQDLVVPLGSHLASFYTSDAGRLRLGLPLLRDGLRSGQSVLLRALPDVLEHHLDALRDEGIDVAEAIRVDQLVLFSNGSRSAGEQVAAYDERLRAASRRRPGPIRALFEVLADLKSVGSVAEHLVVEQQLGALCKRYPVVMLCAYDVRALDGVSVIEALKLHSDIFGGEFGYWLS
ncbi:MAG TPA: MEDS domain-containing protein [Candidatus Limnocylindrales bacterium]|nr:MEDS domain-containing protein [Candidatus Limnocylindrales bacterium]